MDVPGLEEQRIRLLQLAFDSYLKTERWPTVYELARELVDEMDVDEVVRGFSWPWVAASHLQGDQPLALRVLAIARCKGSEAILDGFLRALRLAAERYFDKSANPELTQQVLAQELGLSNEIAHHAMLLIDEQRLSHRRSGDVPGNWVMHFDGTIRKYRSVRTIQDYLMLSGAVKEASAHPLGSREEYAPEENGLERPRLYVPKTAFVMMWLSHNNPHREPVAAAIREAFVPYGIKAEHAMDVDHDGIITEMILKKIEDAEFLVADLTGERPSVYYEVGYAHALGKHPMMMRRKGTHIHFDLSVHNAPEYSDLEDLRAMLARRLNERIGPPPSVRAA